MVVVSNAEWLLTHTDIFLDKAWTSIVYLYATLTTTPVIIYDICQHASWLREMEREMKIDKRLLMHFSCIPGKGHRHFDVLVHWQGIELHVNHTASK